MTRPALTYEWPRAILRKIRDEAGAVAVEFAIVVSLLFFMFFVLLDFGQVAFSQVMAEQAAHTAARIAVVRPAVACAVMPAPPETHTRGAADPAPNYGTSCSAGANICATVIYSCTGAAGNTTASEIWGRIAPLLPAGMSVADLTFTYSTDPNLGFLGGPFTPIVTVDVNLPAYQFISPLGVLAVAAGAASAPIGDTLTRPTFSVSLPAEDLALGDDG